ncbi:uncharacterized protein LOC129574652 [Sitodiplosis mosellana]|uniref:uncharacterized protein LOC129574652 n=1 Tax=Sitodiplosis mosellana TaxID=263140 RepID=UPI002443C1B4|nr:uncharacterized protein LOC129574652 [Sitodiplosis mosellana]
MTGWSLKLAIFLATLNECINASVYQVDQTIYTPCTIIIKIDAILQITHRRTSGENDTTNISMPNNVDYISGYCLNNTASLSWSFNGLQMNMDFELNEIKEWHFYAVQLWYRSYNPLFEQSDQPYQKVFLSGDKVHLLHFETILDIHTCIRCNISLNLVDTNDTSHKAALDLDYFSFQRILKPSTDRNINYKVMLGPILAIAFVLFVAVCLFAIHESKVMKEQN